MHMRALVLVCVLLLIRMQRSRAILHQPIYESEHDGCTALALLCQPVRLRYA